MSIFPQLKTCITFRFSMIDYDQTWLLDRSNQGCESGRLATVHHYFGVDGQVG